MTYLTPEYREYISSDAWKAKAQKKKLQNGARHRDGKPRCESCGAKNDWPNVWLEVNHKHYLTFMHERMGDLEVLCAGPMSKRCHKKADAARRARHGQVEYAPRRARKSWWEKLLGV